MKHHNIDKYEAKTLFISIMYGKEYNLWIYLKQKELNNFNNNKLDLIIDFENSIRNINKLIMDNNDELKNTKIKKKGIHKVKYNLGGKMTSLYLQEKENQILETIYLYLSDKGIINNDYVLCYDSIMIKKHKYYDELLIELSNIIYNKFNINLKFTNKPMNEYYLYILDSHIKEEYKDNIINKKLAQIEHYYNIDNNKYNNIDIKYIKKDELINDKYINENINLTM